MNIKAVRKGQLFVFRVDNTKTKQNLFQRNAPKEVLFIDE
ncbi:hypothetical protein BPO_1647 [Bergeyella porcorum]|uniref:Transposase n=1 Tax=Bergeyella porcorum TaxID=1735111 RepID=A0AAU0F0Q4_9FLAO